MNQQQFTTALTLLTVVNIVAMLVAFSLATMCIRVLRRQSKKDSKKIHVPYEPCQARTEIRPRVRPSVTLGAKDRSVFFNRKL